MTKQLPAGETLSTLRIDPKLLSTCIHCGLCLPACPTYLATGRETESPRGRIYLMDLWSKGELAQTDRLNEHLESCLGCLGCQTACPSGVSYESLLSAARPHLAEKRSKPLRFLMRTVFNSVLPDYPLLKKLGTLLQFWQQKGGALSVPDSKLIPGKLKSLLSLVVSMEAYMPKVKTHVPLPQKSWRSGEKRGEVSLFHGCVMDIFYNHVNHAAINLLKLQRQVVTVPEQTCCGALAAHAGEMDIAQRLAKENIELFSQAPGPVVVTSAGCGAMMKHYPDLFNSDDPWLKRAEEFSARVCDITEFLDSHEFVVQPKPKTEKVAYHAACHLAHAQNVRSQPKRLLNNVLAATKGEIEIEGEAPKLIPLAEEEHCCGSAGIYNFTHSELSLSVLERKMKAIANSGAQVVVTGNPGCLLQLEAGARKLAEQGQSGMAQLRVCHVAEFLNEAYQAEDA